MEPYKIIENKLKENKSIVEEDGLSIPEIRHLLEITKLMSGAINRDEFTKICGIYDDCIDRLMNFTSYQ